MNHKKNIRVAIIESSPIIVTGLRHLLEHHAKLTITQIASSLDRFIPTVGGVDVVIVNPQIVHLSKRELLKHCFNGEHTTQVVALLYGFVEQERLKQFDEVIEITDTEDKVIRKIINLTQKEMEAETEISEISDREKDILISVAKGLTNKEIADEHNISIHTVISHRKNLTKKTGIKTVAGLTVYALLNNFIDQTDVE